MNNLSFFHAEENPFPFRFVDACEFPFNLFLVVSCGCNNLLFLFVLLTDIIVFLFIFSVYDLIRGY